MALGHRSQIDTTWMYYFKRPAGNITPLLLGVVSKDSTTPSTQCVDVQLLLFNQESKIFIYCLYIILIIWDHCLRSIQKSLILFNKITNNYWPLSKSYLGCPGFSLKICMAVNIYVFNTRTKPYVNLLKQTAILGPLKWYFILHFGQKAQMVHPTRFGAI